MRKSLKELRTKIEFWGNDIDEKEIELRDILTEMLKLIDKALPMEVEQD